MAEDRYSKPVAATLITDKLERAKRESENGLRQVDVILERVARHTGPQAKPFRLAPSVLLALNRAAIEGIEATAGAFRTGGMEIHGSALAGQLADVVMDASGASAGTQQ